MDRNGQTRKEPTLADLEAFEKLLRESLHAEPKPHSQTVLAKANPDPAPATPLPEAERASPAERTTPRTADEAAMAELARLIDTPVDFQVPAAARPSLPAPAPPSLPEPARRSAAASLSADPAPSAPVDPLAAFEEELRRFDAIRLAEEQSRAEAQHGAGPYQAPTQDYGLEAGHPDDQGMQGGANPGYPGAQLGPDDSDASFHGAESAAQSSLVAAEERIAAEAAAAAAAAGASGNVRRSRGIFLALGGLVFAGLAVIGGMFALGNGERVAAGGGDIPVIAAKKDPAKEKPAEPGGLEIPNQNKQVLSPRNSGDVKSAQVVTTTEQPLDLNQVTRRESVRVIAPSPYQGANTPIATQPGTPPGTPAVAAPGAALGAAPGAAPADPAAPNGALEPRRVTSVRIPVGGGETAPAGAGPTPAPPATPVPPSRVPVGSAAPTGGGVASSPTPSIASLAAESARGAAETAPGGLTARTPPKVETRPSTAVPAPATAIEAPAPRTETPRAPPPQRVPAPAPQRAASTAPLALGPAGEADRSPVSGIGAFAIQLASRPNEADARSASTSLRGRYSSILSGRAPVVVSGEANGQTVYRVRVAGYSQADANEACRRIKATGGGCFVTRQ